MDEKELPNLRDLANGKGVNQFIANKDRFKGTTPKIFGDQLVNILGAFVRLNGYMKVLTRPRGIKIFKKQIPNSKKKGKIDTCRPEWDWQLSVKL